DEGEYCEPDDKKCRPGCLSTDDCPEGQICNPNTQACTPDNSCTTDDDCGGLEICRDAKCTPVECVTDDQCDAGELCDQTINACRPQDGFCEEDDDCGDDFKCDQERNVCVEAGCGTCPEGTTCNEEAGECWECARDADCGEDGECNLTDNTCVESRCMSDDACTGAQRCNRITGQCEDPEACQADSFEPNDERDAARQVGVGQFSGLGICEGDEDWFSLSLGAGSTVTLMITFTHAEGNLDLELYDPDGTRVGVGSSNTDNETVTVGDLALSGTYRARVLGVDGAAARYVLTVELMTPENPSCTDDGFENNDAPERAAPIIAQDFPSLAICPGDSDWFTIRLSAGERLSVTATFAHADGDLDLVLYEPGGRVVLAESRSTTDNEEASTPPSTITGDFVIQIRGASPAVSNSYQLSVTITEGEPSTCVDDNFEPNDAAAEPEAVEPGIQEGLTICPGNADWFSIALNAGDDIAINLGFTHADGDLELALYVPNSLAEPLAQSRTRSDDEVVGFSDVPVSGLYLVRVFGADPQVTNTYQLRIERTRPPSTCEDDALEDNDNILQALLITDGSTTGQLCSGDEDWYAVQLDGGGGLIATLSFDGAAGNLDLELFAPNGDRLGTSATPNASTEEVSTFDAPVSGRYTLRVFGPLGSEASYSLDVLTEGSTCDDDPQEDNDSREDATRLDMGTFTEQAICPGDDDWYAVELNAGEALTAALAFTHADGDLDLQMVNEAGIVIASSVSLTDNEEATIEPVETAGIVYVRAYGFQDASNTYTLTLTRIDAPNPCEDDPFEPNDSSQSPRSLTLGSWGELRICPGDDDWYAVDMADGEILDLLILFDNDSGDIDAEVRDPSGARVGSSTSVEDEEHITIRAQTTGTYLIRVYGYSGFVTNSYGMDIDVLPPDTCLEDEQEDNDTANDAVDVTTGIYEDLAICQSPDTPDDDWYAVILNMGQQLNALILFTDDDGDLDLELYSLDDTETPLESSTGVRDSEEIRFTAPSDNFYLIRVYGFQGVSNTYDLVIDID
ncbi:MAG: pre-peptidase C-terminal domain-containing protein, partial [Myxococcota bacterium]